jgi:hypothetical protein
LENLICSTPDPYCLTESVVYGNSDGMNEIPNNTKYGQIKNSKKVPTEYSVVSRRTKTLTWIVYYSLVTAQITRLVTAIELIKLLLTYT